MPKFAAYPNIRKVIREYPLATGAAFKEGALVVLTAGEADECGVDPANILGVALHDAGADPNKGSVLVAVATPESTFAMEGTVAPTAGDVGLERGVAKDADGIWVVDMAETTNTRVVIEKVHLDAVPDRFEVRVLAANRQIPG